MTPFKHKTPIQIRFKDIDRLGHVNSAVHLTYFELARVEYFNAFLENNLHTDWPGHALLVAKAEMEYKHQILLDDKIFAYTWVSRIGTKSLDMTFSLMKVANEIETEVARGLAIIVCYHLKSNQTVPVPEIWKEKMLGTKHIK